MKIQCDFCSRDEASVFCCADEAALCNDCDSHVHRANKLASKHQRFSLSCSDQTLPLCDICKERRGLVFCQEDRAILCRDCDDSIHSANQLTMKHGRFLLTGARLSATPLASASHLKEVTELDSNGVINNKPAVYPTISLVPSNGGSSSGSSSISDYLTKTLPGYRVEDLLDDDGSGLYKTEPADLVIEEEFPILVPRVPQIQLSTGTNGLIQCYYGFDVRHSNQKQQQLHELKRPTERRSNDLFMVPQMSSKGARPTAAWNF